MRFYLVPPVLALVSACTLLFEAPADQAGDSDAGRDGDARRKGDASVQCGDLDTDEFVNINLLDVDVDDPSVSASGLELYFNRGFDIWLATREQPCGPWQTPASLGIDGTSVLSNVNLAPSGQVLHFTKDGEVPHTVTRDPRDGTWPVVSVLNQNLIEIVHSYYESRGSETGDVSIQDVFQPSSNPDVLLVTTRVLAVRDMLRVNGATVTDLGLAQNARDAWATADESTVFAEAVGDIVKSTRQASGEYGSPEDVLTPGEDPWLYSSGGRDFLYFSQKVADTNLRHLGVIKLE